MTMSDIINQHLVQGRDFTFAWAMFLDAFFAAGEHDKYKMTHDEPAELPLNHEMMAFLASSVHKLTREARIIVPNWVFQEKFVLKRPFFVGNPSDKLRLVYLVESPPEFKMRNIFTSENTLSRI